MVSALQHLLLLPHSLYHIFLLSISFFVTMCHFALSQLWAYLHQMYTSPVCDCVRVVAVTTLPVTRGNGSWEIKALSCHNERLARWRDLSPVKREGQGRQRERERKREGGERRNNNRAGGKWRSGALNHSFSPWSQSGERQTATDKCYLWVLLLYLFPLLLLSPWIKG